MVWCEFIGRERPELLPTIEQLRAFVWGSCGLTALDVLRIDDLDRSAHHIAVFDGSELVASSQVSLHREVASMRDGGHFAPLLREGTFPAALLNRLVVRPSHAGRALAAEMDARRLAVATRWGARTVLSEVRGRRVAAMRARGFVELGVSPDRRYPGVWSIMAMPLRHQCDVAHGMIVPTVANVLG
jgi:hypothetical protein